MRIDEFTINFPEFCFPQRGERRAVRELGVALALAVESLPFINVAPVGFQTKRYGLSLFVLDSAPLCFLPGTPVFLSRLKPPFHWSCFNEE